MTNFEYNKLLESLRDLYRQGKFVELKKRYLLCRGLLTLEDRNKIESIIGVYRPTESKQDTLVDFCVKEMGYKVVNNLDKQQ